MWLIVIAGAAGGGCLAIVRLVATLIDSHERQSDTPKYGQLLVSHAIILILLAILGGAFAWALSGKAGAFVQGFTTLGMAALLASQTLPEVLGRKHHG